MHDLFFHNKWAGAKEENLQDKFGNGRIRGACCQKPLERGVHAASTCDSQIMAGHLLKCSR
jgi:hypothetical protein